MYCFFKMSFDFQSSDLIYVSILDVDKAVQTEWVITVVGNV